VINDGPGLMLIVEKLPWANTLEVTRGIEAALAELRPGLPGIEIDNTIFRPATFIELSIHNLMRALLIGCVLVCWFGLPTNGGPPSSASWPCSRSPARWCCTCAA
jgi:multidrug efflux pump subunit AcrB